MPIDVGAHLESLVGQEIRTLTERQPNRILRIEGGDVIVGTRRSPGGRPVPIQWLQDAVDLLEERGEIPVDVETLGHRGAFVGAFLATLPGAIVRPTTPRRVALAREPRIDERLEEVRRLVHEHLNAAMIMVPLDDPLDPEMPIADALAYLDENEFDLALLRSEDLRVVYRRRLATVPEVHRHEPVKTRWSSPRGDRLVQHTLELGEVARRLRDDDVPLLVVGRAGPEFIITRSDFTRPAGLVGVLA
ncbi:MAG TPA: hypothetical protein VNJ46_04930 [Gaiellaceae bacterium]|nr:hypothetical protein [Gaiellaceae bacterium]